MRNKLRTILTGFSVAWGIFMLIVLLGAGNGLIHAFEGQSQNMKMNSIKIYPGYTSKPFNGLKEGRRLSLNESDLQLTAEAFPDKVITTGASISKSDAILTFGKEYVSKLYGTGCCKTETGTFHQRPRHEGTPEDDRTARKDCQDAVSTYPGDRKVYRCTRSGLSGNRHLHRPEQFLALGTCSLHDTSACIRQGRQYRQPDIHYARADRRSHQ